jgi:hypothetical protein
MRFTKIILLLITIAIFFVSKFLYIDSEYNCTIFTVPFILPTNISTKEVLKFLKQTDKEEYKDVCTKVKKINKYPACGGLDGGCYYLKNNGTIFIGNDQGNIALASAVVIHEKCHLEQHIEGRGLSESECNEDMWNYIEKITIY